MSTHPFLTGQAQLAQIVKSAMAFGDQLRASQSDAGLRLLHAQLDLLNAGLGGGAVAQLLDLQSGFSDQLAALRKEAARQLGERAQVCTGDLRQAQTGDDVTLVTVGFFSDLGKLLRENAEQTLTLLNSTSAASTVLTGKALDEAIAGNSAGPRRAD
jgi:hypothetical protein